MTNQFNLNFLVSKIEELCNQKQMSVKSALEDCGLKRVVVDNMKKGSVPSIDKIFTLANYFGVSVDYLLGRADSSDGYCNHISNVDTTINGTQANVIHSDNTSDTTTEEFMELFRKLPIEEKIAVMNLVLEKTKETYTNPKV